MTETNVDESSHVDDSLQQQWLTSRHKLTTRPGYNFSQNILFSYLSPFIYPYLCTLVYIQTHYHSLTHTYIYFLLSFQLLHLSYSIYILITLNINLANYTHFAEHSYFTKQAFIRGEVVDASFRVIPAHSRSCWRSIRRPPQDEDSEEEEAEEEEEESEPEAEIP